MKISKLEAENNLRNPSFNLEKEIFNLKKDKDAIILAHYYQDSEIQDIADFIGDSLELSKRAKEIDAKFIVFSGVKFMAEVSKILNPMAHVLVPDMNAGCSLEESCQPKDFAAFRAKHPDCIAVTYINCSAEIKALSDIICTSSNAEKIISSIPSDKKIIFAPDKYLGSYLIKKTGRDMLLWDGSCLVHERFSEEELVKLTVRHQNAFVIAHPECPENLLKYAHHIGSTSSILKFVDANQGKEFIVLTELGIIHQFKKINPNGIFHDVPFLSQGGIGCVSCNSCPFMRLNTMEKVYLALATEEPEILLDNVIRLKAKKALDRMLTL